MSPSNPIRGSQIRLSSEHLDVDVDPCAGAEVLAIHHRSSGTQVMFATPWADRAQAVAEGTVTSLGDSSVARWLERYRGGWQGLFPNPGPERVVGGSSYGFHGETVLANWELVHADQTTLCSTAQLFTIPVVITRTITVAADSVTMADDVWNPTDVTVLADYSQHPALGGDLLDGDCLLEAAATFFVNDYDAPTRGVAPGSQHRWPLITTDDGSVIDLSTFSTQDSRVVLGWLTDFERPWARLTNRSLGLAATLTWDGEGLTRMWIWQELNGTTGWPWYRQARTVALEPATTTSSGPDRERLVEIPPRATRSYRVSLTLEYADRQEPGHR